jgi:phenylpropionate dioxygenase-like ring-hydroxylating dioxygenase large terminal subunit
MKGRSEQTRGEAWLEQEWRSMLRRLVPHIESKTADLGEHTIDIAAHTYTDQNRFEAERRVFQQVPLLAGLSVEIPNPGDRLLFDEAGPPIIVVRATDGSVKAYLNLCPHRGSRVANSCEATRTFTCPFHGWSFGLDGRLLGRPRADGFEGPNEPERRLTPVPVSEWHGMIFVRADPSGETLDVEAFLGEMAPIVVAMELESVALVKAERMDVVDTNWKLAMDTFCEGYHVPVVHGQSLGDQVVPFVTVQDLFGSHGRYIGPGRQLEALAGTPESEWPDSNYSAVHYIFPNTTFTYTDSIDGETPVFTLFRLFPGKSIDETFVLYSTFRPGRPSPLPDAEFQALHDQLHVVVRDEDFVTAANTWRSLQYAPKDMKLVFGRHEIILQEYHRNLARAAGLPLDEG